jgi:hypothetical protein
MLQWIASWVVRSALTPEKQAEKALRELRLELFQAEQRILDAQMHADYYRGRLAFCEAVLKSGIELVSAQTHSGPIAQTQRGGTMRQSSRALQCAADCNSAAPISSAAGVRLHGSLRELRPLEKTGGGVMANARAAYVLELARGCSNISSTLRQETSNSAITDSSQ